MDMKFAHMADCHIGAWRDPKLKDLSTDAFVKSVDVCIQQQVDFVLVAGDLFNTALPGIDGLKTVVKAFKKLKEHQIPVYMIAGSHDFSPSGKTMIDVLEEAGLAKNVVKGTVQDDKLVLKFTIDKKTGAKITGMLGKRGMLEKKFYENLDKDALETEDGFKIFMFHSSITELKPEDMGLMDSYEISYLPKGFEYYAGGHVHIVKQYNTPEYKNVIYPGPIFPASFSEIEKLGNGGFYIYDDGKIIRQDINVKNTFLINVSADNKLPQEVYDLILQRISKKEFLNTIVLLRVAGKLKSGKVSDIDFKEVFNKLSLQGAYFVMKNTTRLVSPDFEEIQIEEKTLEEVEDAIIKEHLQQIKVSNFDKNIEYGMTKNLLSVFESEKHEGEKVYEYEDRIRKEINHLLGI